MWFSYDFILFLYDYIWFLYDFILFSSDFILFSYDFTLFLYDCTLFSHDFIWFLYAFILFLYDFTWFSSDFIWLLYRARLKGTHSLRWRQANGPPGMKGPLGSGKKGATRARQRCSPTCEEASFNNLLVRVSRVASARQ